MYLDFLEAKTFHVYFLSFQDIKEIETNKCQYRPVFSAINNLENAIQSYGANSHVANL